MINIESGIGNQETKANYLEYSASTMKIKIVFVKTILLVIGFQLVCSSKTVTIERCSTSDAQVVSIEACTVISETSLNITLNFKKLTNRFKVSLQLISILSLDIISVASSGAR